jgi:hypothetical protein
LARGSGHRAGRRSGESGGIRLLKI